jgi:hypothetical protein
MSDDILKDLEDLHVQATSERSHYYVATCCLRAIDEIKRLRRAVMNLAIIHDPQKSK